MRDTDDEQVPARAWPRLEARSKGRLPPASRQICNGKSDETGGMICDGFRLGAGSLRFRRLRATMAILTGKDQSRIAARGFDVIEVAMWHNVLLVRYGNHGSPEPRNGEGTTAKRAPQTARL